jgi:hypothetical protein
LPITDHRTAESDVVDNKHLLTGLLAGISYEVIIEPESYHISRIVMTEQNSPRRLDVTYSDYKVTDGGPFPHFISLRVSGEVDFYAELNLSNIQCHEQLEFPFKIPAGYSRM